MAAPSPIQQQLVYLVERAPPAAPNPQIEQIKFIAGIILATLGIAILLGTTIALAGYLTSAIVIATEQIHTFFMMGIVSTIGGFHLMSGGSQSPSLGISVGPFDVTV